jgi:hypothetical protein
VNTGHPRMPNSHPNGRLPSRGSRPHKDKRAITQTTTLLPLFMRAGGRAGDWMACKADKTIAGRLHRTPARGVSLETPVVTPGTDLSRTFRLARRSPCSFKSLLPLPLACVYGTLPVGVDGFVGGRRMQPWLHLQ